jgi:ArsR family transcriptional regulator
MNADLDDVSSAERLRAVSDPLRWRILELLGDEELCVCHLTELLDAPQSLVSHHLRVLRDADLVETERFRYWTYYRLRPDALAALGNALLELAGGAPVAGPRRRPCG